MEILGRNFVIVKLWKCEEYVQAKLFCFLLEEDLPNLYCTHSKDQTLAKKENTATITKQKCWLDDKNKIANAISIIKYARSKVNSIYSNGNWTKWSAIQFEIKQVISKSTSMLHLFDLKSQVWFQTKMKFNYHFITSILHKNNYIACIQHLLVCTNILLIQYWATLYMVPKVLFHFPAFQLVTKSKPWNFIDCFVLVKLSNLLQKRCSCKKWCHLWINCTCESQSNCKNHQWFQNGYNKSDHHHNIIIIMIIINYFYW